MIASPADDYLHQPPGLQAYDTSTYILVPEHAMQEKAAPPSNLDSLLRPSPRARYNSAFASRLLKILESNPEADLTSHISNYRTERLNELRGASAIILPVPDIEREPEIVQQRMPEPCGDFSIVSPLAPQVQTLFGLHSLDTSNGGSNFVSVFWRLLNQGKVLHQVLSKWIVKITASIVVKFAPGLDISEYQTMCHVWSHRENIPIPEPLGAISIGSCNYILMSYIEGDPLANLWPNLSPELKSSVRSQLEGILQCLRRMPLQSKYFGSGDPPLCRDLRRHVRTSTGSISTEMEFKAFLISTRRELNPVYRDLITSTLSTNHQTVMTHSDLRPENILVLQKAPNTIRITGLIDWELSGAYPEYWEYVKALAGVTWSLSDWYSYLPVDTIGNHINAWRQERLIDQLVL